MFCSLNIHKDAVAVSSTCFWSHLTSEEWWTFYCILLACFFNPQEQRIEGMSIGIYDSSIWIYTILFWFLTTIKWCKEGIYCEMTLWEKGFDLKLERDLFAITLECLSSIFPSGFISKKRFLEEYWDHTTLILMVLREFQRKNITALSCFEPTMEKNIKDLGS